MIFLKKNQDFHRKGTKFASAKFIASARNEGVC